MTLSVKHHGISGVGFEGEIPFRHQQLEFLMMEERKMSKESKRILLAVDSSPESLASVRYVAESVQANGAEIVIYQVMSKVPEVFWDMGNDPAWQDKIETVRLWEQKQDELAANFMETALEVFAKAGFTNGKVTARIGKQQEGIARDLVAEARRGYDVLVVGRGKSVISPDMPLGSVASKVLSAANTFSVWLIGAKPSSDKVLIAIDSSDSSMRSVGHAGQMLNRKKNKMTLFHAIRGISISTAGLEDIFPEAYRQRLLGDAERDIQPVIKLASARLGKMDIAPDRVSSQIRAGVKSRAAAVVEEAKAGDYGTIVVGRRGLSEVAEFTMGRVTNKLIQLAKDQALCIVA